jgi:hypothetical protein
VTAPQRYRVQFTIGEEAHEKLRRLQALLRREIPDGDPGKMFTVTFSAPRHGLRARSAGVAGLPASGQAHAWL